MRKENRGKSCVRKTKCVQISAVSEKAPVDADGAEVEDTGGAHHDIQREQDVTVDETEAPFSHHLQQNKHKLASVFTHTSLKTATFQGLLSDGINQAFL